MFAPGEVEAIIGVLPASSARGLRNRALVWLMRGSGLRIAEALALRPPDLDLSAPAIRVLHGKGDRDRRVALAPDALPALEAWLERRRVLGYADDQPVFCTHLRGPRGGRPLEPTYVRRMLRRAAREAGVARRAHPHALRHTLATELAREGWPLPAVQAQLGHASAATTDRYLRRVAAHELVDLMRSRRPVRPASPAPRDELTQRLQRITPERRDALISLLDALADEPAEGPTTA